MEHRSLICAARSTASCRGSNATFPLCLERFFTVVHEGTSVVAGKEIAPKEVVDLDDFLVVIHSSKGDTPTHVELVKIDGWYSYDYTYDDKGNLVRTVVDNGFRKSILEPGKEPQFIHNKQQP